MKKKPVLAILAVIILFGIVFFIILTRFVYIGEIVKKGSAYGFEITMSKEAAFKILLEKSNRNEIDYISFFSATDKNQNQLSVSSENSDKIITMNDWSIRIKSKAPIDNIRLKFKDGKLLEIYRHRDLFEVP